MGERRDTKVLLSYLWVQGTVPQNQMCFFPCVPKLTSSFPVLLCGQVISRNPLWSARFTVSEPGGYHHEWWWWWRKGWEILFCSVLWSPPQAVGWWEAAHRHNPYFRYKLVSIQSNSTDLESRVLWQTHMGKAESRICLTSRYPKVNKVYLCTSLW